MSDDIDYLELRCPDCSWSEVCGREGQARWLRAAKKIRAGREPEAAILEELFRSNARHWACPRCGRTGLAVAVAVDEAAWGDEPLCAECRRPISRDRLEAVPGTTRCAACQQNEEQGRSPEGVEYCPRCGAAMALRLSGAGGLSRYVLVCTGNPPCRR